MGKCLIIRAADKAKDEGLPYLENYVGIVFKRGTSNGGEEDTTKEYVKMIGAENLVNESAFLNLFKVAQVKNARVTNYLNQDDWTKNEDGTPSDLTGQDGRDVYLCHDNLYVIFGGTDPVYEVYAISSEPFSYNNDAAILVPMGGIPVDYGVVKDGKLRQIRDDSVLGTQSATAVAASDIYGPDHKGGFPTTALNRYEYEATARALNDDVNSNTPYMNETCFDIELIMAWLYIEFRSKYINKYVGDGISSNQVPTEANWGKVTGCKITGDGVEKFYTLGNTVYKYGSSNNTSGQIWKLINNQFPLLKTFESQLSGNLEKVTNSDSEIISAPMTGVYTKTFSFVATFALTSDSEPKEYTVSVVLRNPVVRGKSNLFGHLMSCYSGYELTRTVDSDNNQHHTVYRAKSIDDCVMDASDTNFDYEAKYENIGEIPVIPYNSKGGFAKNSLITKEGVNTPFAKEKITDGGIYNYDACLYYTDILMLSVGDKQRKMVTLGSHATHSPVLLRFFYISDEPSRRYYHRGSAPRVALRSV